MNFLQSRLGPFPVWVWGMIVIGGIVVFFVVQKLRSGAPGNNSTLGQNPSGQVNPLNPTNDPALDPNTGIPYQIEEAIDPNTGLPYYIELTSGATSPGQAGGGPQGPTGPIPPGPGPSTGPGTAPGTAPSTAPVAVAGNQFTVPAGRAGFGPIPPQPGPGGGGGGGQGPIPPQPGPGVRPGMKPIPPVPGPHGTGEPGEEWNYPFWIGQGGSLYARGA